MACPRLSPHMSTDGFRLAQTAGREACPKILQRSSSSSWRQGTPAGLPFGIPGIGEEIEGAMQQAAQPGRHAGTVVWAGRVIEPPL